MSFHESEPLVDPDDAPSKAEDHEPHVDPDRPLDPPEDTEDVDPDRPLDPPGGPDIETSAYPEPTDQG